MGLAEGNVLMALILPLNLSHSSRKAEISVSMGGRGILPQGTVPPVPSSLLFRDHAVPARVPDDHGPVLEHLHGLREAGLQPEILDLEPADAAVERLGTPCPAEARDVVLQEPVGTVLPAGDPPELDLEVLRGDQVLDAGLLAGIRRRPAGGDGGKVPDHDLAVGMDPGPGMVREVLEGQDDGIELGIVVGGTPLVGKEDLLPREERDTVAIPAPVHHDREPAPFPRIVSGWCRSCTVTPGRQKEVGEKDFTGRGGGTRAWNLGAVLPAHPPQVMCCAMTLFKFFHISHPFRAHKGTLLVIGENKKE